MSGSETLNLIPCASTPPSGLVPCIGATTAAAQGAPKSPSHDGTEDGAKGGVAEYKEYEDYPFENTTIESRMLELLRKIEGLNDLFTYHPLSWKPLCSEVIQHSLQEIYDFFRQQTWENQYKLRGLFKPRQNDLKVCAEHGTESMTTPARFLIEATSFSPDELPIRDLCTRIKACQTLQLSGKPGDIHTYDRLLQELRRNLFEDPKKIQSFLRAGFSLILPELMNTLFFPGNFGLQGTALDIISPAALSPYFLAKHPTLPSWFLEVLEKNPELPRGMLENILIILDHCLSISEDSKTLGKIQDYLISRGAFSVLGHLFCETDLKESPHIILCKETLFFIFLKITNHETKMILFFKFLLNPENHWILADFVSLFASKDPEAVKNIEQFFSNFKLVVEGTESEKILELILPPPKPAMPGAATATVFSPSPAASADTISLPGSPSPAASKPKCNPSKKRRNRDDEDSRPESLEALQEAPSPDPRPTKTYLPGI